MLGWYSGSIVSPQAVWGWVQAAGQASVETLQKHLHALAQGDLQRGALGAGWSAAPLVLGADWVLVPFRRTGGQPTGEPNGRGQSRGVGPLEPASHAHPQGHHPAAPASAVAAWDIEALKPRLWLEAVRQGTARWWSGSVNAHGGLWRLYKEPLRVGVGILDFYHAVQDLWKGRRL